ncbi:MFS transporter [Photorhabdus laumondii subsp. laumondii]|uniref:MFS transporter n=1 Tax=Photorhabdus laumondii subsp. laumondii TaxID=141679 RepID=A0A6L9JSP4_PHOLM|nr:MULTISPECIES: MFS transporter [Photorhabdus]MCC8385021.1 MFS transporter [Photorhabdus laumondii]MCC8414445.1 MFS transporter [Photorhabdus laumondii]NDK96141.1 MFS transporter [Photorhabdus laumondii subsp. laumondii]NDL22408.1 MFS transporter [Photorhabdus laumondii subsp. laumondii]NDL31394.1 MFS transporter [Photorhabdus laumondii subsp. laumondii]
MNSRDYRNNNFFAIFTITTSVAVIGIVIGLTIPMIALRLNSQGIDELYIGLISAAPALGVLLSAPVVQKIVALVGKKHVMMIATGVSAGSLLPLLGSLPMELLFPLRLVTGAASGLMICLGETWINELSEENKRGRVLAVYTTVFTISQLLGPSIIAFYGIADKTPILICTLIHIFSLVLFVMVDQKKGDELPQYGKKSNFSIVQFVRIAPAICGGVLFFSFFDGTILSMFPIYGMSCGYTEAVAALMISVVLAGDAVMQLPFGWLADHMNRMRLYQICGVATLGASALLPFVMTYQYLIWPLLIVLGATAGAIYTIALVQIGQYFSGNDLIVANAAAAMLWGIGSLFGPLLAGIASSVTPSGLPILLVVIAALFLISTMDRFNPQSNKSDKSEVFSR